MGQMKKLWEEQRDFDAIEDRVDWNEVVDGLRGQVQTPYTEYKTLRPQNPTTNWEKLQELNDAKESKDEWRLWD